MDFVFDLENPLTSSTEHQSDTVPSLFADESVIVLHSFPANFRRQAVSVISKLSENLDPFVPYLAVNYIDRFISARNFPNQEKPWIVSLVAISCLSLALKMKNSDLSLAILQGYEGSIHDPKSIHRMEILILTSLKWRMRSITPFSFLCYFVSLLEIGDSCLSQAIKHRASKIIFESAHGIELLKFRPSVIAASALVEGSQDLVPLQYLQFRAAISSCKYIKKENLDECLGVMQDIAYNRDYLTSNHNALSSVRNQHHTTSECVSGTSIKRRKINGVLNDDDTMTQFSQIHNW